MNQEFPFPMPTLARSPHGLLVEQVALADIAERFGTPVYVYSRAALTEA
jgi:diaminopimelate decarboxylase